MVEMSMSSNPNSQLDVKLCLDLSAKQMSPVVKRVRATDYATLMAQAAKLAAKYNLSEEGCQLRYHDGDNWVIVEDDQDLELAFAIATSTNMKLQFNVRPAGKPQRAAQEDDEEMKEEEQPLPLVTRKERRATARVSPG